MTMLNNQRVYIYIYDDDDDDDDDENMVYPMYIYNGYTSIPKYCNLPVYPYVHFFWGG